MAYEFAHNRTKLAQAVKAVEIARTLDHAIVVNEESVKAEYIKRGGLVLEVAEVKEEGVVMETPAVARARRTRKA